MDRPAEAPTHILTFRDAVRAARERHRLTQEELAFELGLIDGRAVSYIETRAAGLPPPDLFVRLTDRLGLSRVAMLAAVGYLLPEDVGEELPLGYRFDRGSNGELVRWGVKGTGPSGLGFKGM